MTALDDLRDSLEWNCNETGNHKCRVHLELTETHEADGRRALEVVPLHDERGEPVRAGCWGRVLRECVLASREHDGLIFSATPGRVVVTETPG